MAKQVISHPENQKDVYKFWLGFLEKVIIVLITVVIIPRIIRQLSYSFEVLIWAVVSVLVLLAVMMYLSRRLWYLPKDDNKENEDKEQEEKNHV